jgi:hypothetical protein
MILRCTGKLLDLLAIRVASLATASPSDDDWYASLLWFDRRKCLLLVHAGTLFSTFAADVRKSDLTPIGSAVVKLIEHELRRENLPPNTFGELDAGSVTVAKTASRVVLGYMNEMARFCENAMADSGGLRRFDLRSFNHELRRELHLSRQPPGYIVPIDLARGQPRGSRALDE